MKYVFILTGSISQLSPIKEKHVNHGVKGRINMKRHMRDQHEVMSVSTSPPTKRKKRSIDTIISKTKGKESKESEASKDKPKNNVPNIKEVPTNCKHLVDSDDVLYSVPGDGCCGPNCGAALLFEDEVLTKTEKENEFVSSRTLGHKI